MFAIISGSIKEALKGFWKQAVPKLFSLIIILTLKWRDTGAVASRLVLWTGLQGDGRGGWCDRNKWQMWVPSTHLQLRGSKPWPWGPNARLRLCVIGGLLGVQFGHLSLGFNASFCGRFSQLNPSRVVGDGDHPTVQVRGAGFQSPSPGRLWARPVPCYPIPSGAESSSIHSQGCGWWPDTFIATESWGGWSILCPWICTLGTDALGARRSGGGPVLECCLMLWICCQGRVG